MKKTTYQNQTMNILVQQDSEVSTTNCLKGVMSLDENGDFRFEEEVRKGRPARNPKLHDGKFLSMVRMQNGKYQFHMKTFPAEAGLDGSTIAREIYREVKEGFKIINA